ncbi:hypothetical protein [Dactylosporangium sp. NPDC000521]|uniref:hypothetical protein n=1 Tax=Dactylosporangium sp. NPDC000521 TaxID=3363975 RepID=UPI0036AF3D2E
MTTKPRKPLIAKQVPAETALKLMDAAFALGVEASRSRAALAKARVLVGHFQRRRLALGDCGRAYGTSCIHEHSCVRCPLLRVDPDQRQRLTEIRDNLITRISEAEHEGWLGEAEGLRVSLAAARDKLAQTDGAIQRRNTAIALGIPTFPAITGRTVTTSTTQVSPSPHAEPHETS